MFTNNQILITKANTPNSMAQELPAALANLLIDENITDLTLSNTTVSNYRLILETIKHRKSLLGAKAQGIKVLMLDNTGIQFGDLSTLDLIIKESPTCTTLNLSYNRLGVLVSDIFKIVKRSAIQKLILKNVEWWFSETDLHEFVKTCNLVELDLSGNYLGFNDFFALQKVLATRKNELVVACDSFRCSVYSAKQLIANIQQESSFLFKSENTNKLFGETKPTLKKIKVNASGRWIKSTAPVEKAENKKVVVDLVEEAQNFLRQNQQKIHVVNNPTHDSFLDCQNLLQAQRMRLIENAIRVEHSTHKITLEPILNTEENSKYRNDCRAKKNISHCLPDYRFNYYPINQLSNSYYISEGPENEYSMERFLCEIFRSDNIKKIIAIGEPHEGERYFNYFKEEREYNQFQLKIQDPISPIQKYPHIRQYDLEIISKEMNEKSKKVVLFVVGLRVGNSTFKYDDNNDNNFFYDMAINESPESILLHDDIGLGFAPMTALAMQLFRDFTHYFTGTPREVADKIMNKILLMRELINVGIFPDVNFVLSAINLAVCIGEVHSNKIASSNVQFKHTGVEIKKIALLGMPEDNEKIIDEVIGAGIMPINFLSEQCNEFFNVIDTSPDATVKNNLFQNTFLLRLRELIECQQISCLLVTTPSSEKSLLSMILNRVPDNFLVIHLKPKNAEISLVNRLVLNNEQLDFFIGGVLNIKKDIHLAKFEVTKVVLGPLHLQHYFLKLLKTKFTNVLNLLDTEENYNLIPFLLSNSKFKTILEIPSLEIEMLSKNVVKIKLKNLPLVKSEIPTKNDFIMLPLCLDQVLTEKPLPGRESQITKDGNYITKISDEEAFNIGEQLAIRINNLHSHFKVVFTLSFDNKINDKLLVGLRGKIVSPDLIVTKTPDVSRKRKSNDISNNNNKSDHAQFFGVKTVKPTGSVDFKSRTKMEFTKS